MRLQIQAGLQGLLRPCIHPPIRGMALRAVADTVCCMYTSCPPPARPGEPSWDRTFTRLTQAVRPRMEAFAHNLGRRFLAMGLGCDRQARQTPRGQSNFVALLGARGLIGIVDLTLVDGIAVGQGPCAMLDIRLLDACGDVVAGSLGKGLKGHVYHENSALQVFTPENMDRAATAVYVAALGHFDLRPTTGQS